MVKIVKKPWGEEQWLELNESYCFKRILLNADQRTSLQYHHDKLETNYVLKGVGRIVVGLPGHAQADDDSLSTEIFGKGDCVTIKPNTLHRITAITDLEFVEVSTPEVDDVIRVEDDSCRSDGHIESEHK